VGAAIRTRRLHVVRGTKFWPQAVVALGVLACLSSSSPFSVSSVENHYVSAPHLRPPTLKILDSSSQAAPGYLFLGPTGIGQRGPEIVDDTGQPVWFQPSPAGQHAMDVRVQTYRGQRVLTYWQGVTRHAVGYGTEHILNDHYQQIAVVHAGNGLQADLHEFVITKQNTALLTAFQSIPANLSADGGSTHDHLLDSVIQEVDIRTGKVLFQWRASQHVPLSASYRSRSSDGSQPWDYFHVNSIDVEPDGNLLVSARNTHALYEINRRTGAVMWVLGGKDSSFTMGPGTQFAWQHDAIRQPNGTITLFDDEASPKVMSRSRALTLGVNMTDHTVTLVRSLISPDKLLSTSQGSVQMLPNGDSLVGYGNKPYITEYNPAGAVVFNARFTGPGEDSYRAYRFTWEGLPGGRPSLAVRSAGSGRWTGYASWNGATQIADWQVLQGSTRHGMTVVDTVPRRSFETAIHVAGSAGDLVVVRAVDIAGHVLGRSRVVPLQGTG
jgi:hypothetical protein